MLTTDRKCSTRIMQIITARHCNSCFLTCQIRQRRLPLGRESCRPVCARTSSAAKKWTPSKQMSSSTRWGPHILIAPYMNRCPIYYFIIVVYLHTAMADPQWTFVQCKATVQALRGMRVLTEQTLLAEVQQLSSHERHSGGSNCPPTCG